MHDHILFASPNMVSIKPKLTFITANAGKAKYLSDYFHIPIAHIKLDLPEIQSMDLQEIVKDKAQRAFDIVKKPVLVEDVSLIFKSLNKLPGPFIKWFLDSLGNDGLCKLVDKLENREAYAEVKFALCDEYGVKIFSGTRKGTISDIPRGNAGFGWDSIFIPQGYHKTWAEMSDQEKHETSMRKIALKSVKKYLEQYEIQ